MGMSIPLIAMFSLILALYSGFSENLLRNQSQTLFFMQKKKELSSSDSAIEVAKEALRKDLTWNDCLNSDSLCADEDDTGLFPLFSETLDRELKNIDLGSGKENTSVYFYPLSETEGIIFSEVKDENGKYVHAQLIQQGFESANDFLPIFYGKEISIEDKIDLCSYSFNSSTNIVGAKVNPKLSIYMNQNLSDKLEVIIPDNGLSDVETYSNLSDFAYNNDFKYKRLYSTGNIYLEDNSEIDSIYSNLSVTQGVDVIVGTITENGQMTYPDFSNIDNKEIIESTSKEDIVCRAGTFLTIEEGEYNKLTVKTGCSMYLSGKNFKFNTIEGSFDERYTNKGVIYFYGDIVNLSVNNLNILTKGYIEFNNLNIPAKFLTINSNNVDIKGKLEFFDPKGARLESNSFSMTHENSSFKGELISKLITLNQGAEIKGKIYGETFVATGSDISICNLVDENGDEYSHIKWEDISWDETGSGQNYVKVVDVIKQDYCKEKVDCLTRLKEFYENRQVQ